MVVRARGMVPAAAEGQAGVTGNGASGPRNVHRTFATAEVLATAKAFVSHAAEDPGRLGLTAARARRGATVLTPKREHRRRLCEEHG
jgi:hypothetical protein